MKKAIYLNIIGAFFVVGLVVGLALFLTDKEDTARNKDNGSQGQAVDVAGEAIEVVKSDDGSIAANNLFIPWTINKNGDTFFLSQREGNVIEIDGDLGLVEVQKVKTTEDIVHEGEGGFLGFTLAPDFETTKKAFAYHTYKKDGKTLNRIIALTLKGNTWNETEVLLDKIPGGEKNNGGRIQIGPDGKLYVTTGDTGNGEVSQDLESLAGKILRLNLNGDIPGDNPFENSYVYSFGHRNPQGLAWDNNGNLYSSEHGESGHDEINLIKAGKNYGWPVIEGNEGAINMVKPIYQSGDKTWAPSGMAFYDGQLYIASLAGSKILTYDIASGKVAEFFDDAGRLRDILIEDESLFTITNNKDKRGKPGKKDDRLIQMSLTQKASSN